MAYPAAAIANEFLDLAELSNRRLTQMEVQKLVYFAHGWNLALRSAPLINERVQAWDYGPVVKSLYKAFREFGSSEITKKASVPNWAGNQLGWMTPCINGGESRTENEFTRALVGKVWAEYGKYRAFELSEMTHIAGSPWDQARKKNDEFIDDDQIRAYFAHRREAGDKRSSGEKISVDAGVMPMSVGRTDQAREI